MGSSFTAGRATARALKEFKSVGTIDALSSAVFAVLNDVEAYPSFMPYTSECSVLKRTGDCTIAYQRLALPLVSDRDYTLRSEHSKTLGAKRPDLSHPMGTGQRPRSAGEAGCRASQDLRRRLADRTGWRGNDPCHLHIYTDSGGAIPAVIANSGSRTAIRKMFAAIRKAVHEPKYAARRAEADRMLPRDYGPPPKVT